MANKPNNSSKPKAEEVSDEVSGGQTIEQGGETASEVKEVDEPKTEEQTRLELAKELNLTVRTDPGTGKAILPSTPAMRAAAARKKVKPVVEDSSMDIEAFVKDRYGENAVSDVNIKLVMSTLATYVKHMSPSASIDEKQGGIQQEKLANLYDVVLSLKPEIAQVALEIIVSVVKQNINGAFTPRSALRFANTMPLDKDRAIRFQLLTTLFITMGSGTAKKDLAKKVNVRQLLEYVTERNAKANISEFIN